MGYLGRGTHKKQNRFPPRIEKTSATQKKNPENPHHSPSFSPQPSPIDPAGQWSCIIPKKSPTVRITPSQAVNQQSDLRESIPCYSMLYHSRLTPALGTLVCSQ